MSTRMSLIVALILVSLAFAGCAQLRVAAARSSADDAKAAADCTERYAPGTDAAKNARKAADDAAAAAAEAASARATAAAAAARRAAVNIPRGGRIRGSPAEVDAHLADMDRRFMAGARAAAEAAEALSFAEADASRAANARTAAAAARAAARTAAESAARGHDQITAVRVAVAEGRDLPANPTFADPLRQVEEVTRRAEEIAALLDEATKDAADEIASATAAVQRNEALAAEKAEEAARYAAEASPHCRQSEQVRTLRPPRFQQPTYRYRPGQLR